MRDCLLLIDVQNGFLSDETCPVLEGLEELCRMLLVRLFVS